jgi:hypothetical protein
MDGIFLRSLEGLEDPPQVPSEGEVWQWLRGEKEAIKYEILSDGPLCRSAMNGAQGGEASVTPPRAIGSPAARDQSRADLEVFEVPSRQFRIRNPSIVFSLKK